MKPSALIMITWAIILIGLSVISFVFLKSMLYGVICMCLGIIDLGAYFATERIHANKKAENKVA